MSSNRKSLVVFIMPVAPPDPTWNDVCTELAPIRAIWRAFGMALGVPKFKMDEYESKREPLSEVISYWDNGNVADKPMTWKAVAETLRSPLVSKPKLAKQIEDKYKCQ